jgi:hypothetical protein
MSSAGAPSKRPPRGKRFRRGGGEGFAPTELARRIFKRQGVWIELVIVAVGLMLGYSAYLWWSSDPLARLVELSGAPERDSEGSAGQFGVAELGDEFHEGDGARTNATSEAHFALSGGARLVLKPSSQVRFQRRRGREGTLGISVELGQVEVRVDEEPLSLSSGFGELLLKPRTALGLTRKGKRLGVRVNFGRVELAGPGGGISLEAGQSLELEIGGIVIEPQMPERGPEKPIERPAPLEAPPDFDLAVRAGESFTVHDPNPPTRLAFREESCLGSLRLELDERSVTGEGLLAAAAAQGRHSYRVTCLASETSSSGKFEVVRDVSGRALPAFAPHADVKTDGRKYTVLYQVQLPHVTVRWPNAPASSSYSLLLDGQNLASPGPEYSLRPPLLRPGSHSLVFVAHTSPERRSRTTTLAVQPDASLLVGQVGEPASDFEAGAKVPLSGQAQPGWTVSLEGRKIELDAARRFSLEAEPQGTLAVMFSHPERGTHYYLRRPRPAL